MPELESAAAFREPNVWPGEAVLPGWRAAMLGYSGTCRAISLAVIGAAARGLGLDADALLAPCRGRNATLRLLHYPELPADFELLTADGSARQDRGPGRATVAREHIDTGLLTILWQDSRGGLQMKGRDGTWREVPPVPGALSIHCGDLLAAAGGAAMAPTPHRVLGGAAERFSIGFFLEPDFSTEILPPEGGAAKTYARHLTDQFPTRFLEPA